MPFKKIEIKYLAIILSSGAIALFLDYWLDVNPDFLTTLYASNPTQIKYIIFGTIAVLTLLGIFILRKFEKLRASFQLQLGAEEEMSRIQSEFMAELSHELRIPLNGMIGITAVLLQDNTLPVDKRDSLKILKRTSTTLLETMDDMIELSKIRAGSAIPKLIPFIPRAALDEAINTATILAGDKGLAVEINYKGDFSTRLLGDADIVGRILKKLVVNAINRTDLGFIRIEMSCEKKDKDVSILSVAVIDNGAVIPLKNQGYAFAERLQMTDDLSLHFGGVGLSVTIAKELAQRMGGHVGIISSPEAGSRFSFSIPFKNDQTVKNSFSLVGKDDRHPVTTVRVLIAEDHPLNQAYIKKFLDSAGIENFFLVETGTAAIEHSLSGKYDIILMDCHMQDISGYEAVQRIREAEKIIGSRIPIIGMTANTLADEREKCLQHGMDDQIGKPIDATFLRAIMGRWVSMESKPKSLTELVPSPPREAIVDLAMLKTFAGNDRNAEKEFANLFVRQSDINIKTLSENCTEGENKIWKETAHQFKGGAANMGAERLRKLCEQAQAMLNGTAKERTIIFKKIEAAYQKVKEALIKEDLL